MKDEASGNAITEFVGLRPKKYSFQMVRKKANGTLDTVVKHRRKASSDPG